MNWYVSRKGETVGPVQDWQVRQWAEDGQWDLHVREDAVGSNWMPIMQSPFSGAVRIAARNHRDYLAGTVLAVVFPFFGFVVGIVSILGADPVRKKLGWHMVVVSILVFGLASIAMTVGRS